jgi:hypothetical protein
VKAYSKEINTLEMKEKHGFQESQSQTRLIEMIDIPEPVKRIVRQEAGFGCCKCGLPIIEYHHIVKDSKKPEDIMLLCPTCHTEATVKAMPEPEQMFYKANPFNIKAGYVEGMLKVNQDTPVVNVGTNQFIGEGDFLLVDGENLLSITVNEGRLELSMKLFDQKDQLVAKIERNEWISGDALPWDMESSFQWLRIRRKIRDIELEIDARKYPFDIRADMWRKGVNFQLSPDSIMFKGVKASVGFENLCFVAIRLEADTLNKAFRIAPNACFGSGHFISESNVSKRVELGLQEWRKLICKHAFVIIIDKKKYAVKKCGKCGKIEKTWK